MSRRDDQQNIQAAISLHQAGQLDQAAELYRQIISRDAKNFHALHYLGMIESSLGNYERAKALLHRSLAIEPPSIQFVENYATILFQMGDYKSALESAKRGLNLTQSNAGLLYVAALSLFKLKRLEESIIQFDKLLAIAPNHVAAINERGAVFAEMKHYDAALDSVKRALTIEPRYAEAHLNAGNIFGALERYDAALVAFDKALALKAELADAWLGRGNVLVEFEQYESAIAAYDRALSTNPGLVAAWVARGSLFLRIKQHDKALAAYDRALALNPTSAEAWLGRGNVACALKRYDDALMAYDRALALKPDLAEVWLGRGGVCTGLVQYDNALAAYDNALALNTDLAEAWLGRGVALAALSRHDEAFAAYDRAVKLKANLDYAAGARLFTKLSVCDWNNLHAETAQLLAIVREGLPASSPFSLLTVNSSAADQRQCAERRARDQRAFAPLSRGELCAHDRIRVAYLSADFREHPVAYLIAGLLEHHDRSRFEITALSLAPDRASPMRDRIKGAVEHFIDVGSNSDQEIAELIRRCEIDIVIDLMGLTQHNRLDVMARRPAPIQVNYLGYSGTTGTSFIDYTLADATVIPQEHRAFYSEEVVWLPDCYLITDDRRVIAERTPSRSECALPEDGFVFCCFNNTYKLGPETFQVWMRLLKATPGSVLWLSEANATAQTNLRREAEQSGLAAQRLIFAPRLTDVADHLARQRQADLFLDTLPYNAHTTACDALWAGVPLVTCLGTTLVGRVAASLLKAVGLDELITQSLNDYEAVALKLAHDPAWLTVLRDKLARNKTSFPLFDTARTTRQIEAAYTMMWQRYQKGETRKPAVVTA